MTGIQKNNYYSKNKILYYTHTVNRNIPIRIVYRNKNLIVNILTQFNETERYNMCII